MNSKNKAKISIIATLLVLPLVSLAAAFGPLNDFGAKIIIFINNSLVPLVFAIALLLFIYGVYLYFIQGAGEEESRKTGRSYILWAIIALVVMVSIWGITNLIAGGLGFDKKNADDLIPKGIQPKAGGGGGTGGGGAGGPIGA